MKGRVRVCAEGGKIKKRTRTKSETENWRGGGNVWCWSSSFSSSPKISDCVAVFFQIAFIHSFIFFLYLSMSLGLWFSIWPFLDMVSPHRPPARSTPFFPQAPSNPQQISGINSVPSLSGRLSLSFPIHLNRAYDNKLVFFPFHISIITINYERERESVCFFALKKSRNWAVRDILGTN